MNKGKEAIVKIKETFEKMDKPKSELGKRFDKKTMFVKHHINKGKYNA
tara:strand:+ start:134 stop:277 length:144 start_codon:yes stop_codon:yes gene_type:complete